MTIAFGPVPSRRLGRSMGINNIPPKVCSYSCAYCQVGRTIKLQVERRAFYDPEEIFKDVKEKVERSGQVGEPIEYLTFVPDGEPTLDIHLGREMELLKALGIKVAVITNASLLWREDVREELLTADWISLKVDSTREEIWRKLNRPYRTLQLTSILDGMLEFAKVYRGTLVTEMMLVKDVNDSPDQLKDVADFLAQLKPTKAYLAIPIRPPAEAWVRLPDEKAINQAYQIFHERIDGVEWLIADEGTAFAPTGNAADDLLGITAVHPMRKQAVAEFLARAKQDWSLINKLIAQELLREVEYEGKTFYMRRIHKPVSPRMTEEVLGEPPTAVRNHDIEV
ncbi:MAG: radical SAM protein [Acidobacteria bacterium]|nr:radical SAM protein [Acidobacteriota bacterium]